MKTAQPGCPAFVLIFQAAAIKKIRKASPRTKGSNSEESILYFFKVKNHFVNIKLAF
jgi:hypothetical protein